MTPQPAHSAEINRAQINIANAQHSTGPKTPEGKKKSSLNALRHGLTGQIVVMPTEDLEAYQSHLKSFADECDPQGAIESNLVQALADASWRLNRAAALEANLLTLAAARHPLILDDAPSQVRDALAIAAALESQTKALSNLSIHTQRLSRQFERTAAQLRELQETRRARRKGGTGQPPRHHGNARIKRRTLPPLRRWLRFYAYPNRDRSARPAPRSPGRKSPQTPIRRLIRDRQEADRRCKYPINAAGSSVIIPSTPASINRFQSSTAFAVHGITRSPASCAARTSSAVTSVYSGATMCVPASSAISTKLRASPSHRAASAIPGASRFMRCRIAKSNDWKITRDFTACSPIRSSTSSAKFRGVCSDTFASTLNRKSPSPARRNTWSSVGSPVSAAASVADVHARFQAWIVRHHHHIVARHLHVHLDRVHADADGVFKRGDSIFRHHRPRAAMAVYLNRQFSPAGGGTRTGSSRCTVRIFRSNGWGTHPWCSRRRSRSKARRRCCM